MRRTALALTISAAFACSTHTERAPDVPVPTPRVAADPTPPKALRLNVGAEIRELRAAADLIEARAEEAIARGDLALAALERIDPEKLTSTASVVIQNAALQIAIALSNSEDDAAIRWRAAALAEKVALPPVALAHLEDQPLAPAETWLGAKETWIERTTRFCGDGPLFHERKLRAPLAFHPVRSGDRRALISSMIAFDTDGKPHLTSIIQSVEMRIGMEVDAPVSVLELDVESLRTESPTLFAPAYADVHESKFVQKNAVGGFTCTQSCHQDVTQWGAADVINPVEAALLRQARTENSLRHAARRFGRVAFAQYETPTYSFIQSLQ